MVVTIFPDTKQPAAAVPKASACIVHLYNVTLWSGMSNKFVMHRGTPSLIFVGWYLQKLPHTTRAL